MNELRSDGNSLTDDEDLHRNASLIHESPVGHTPLTTLIMKCARLIKHTITHLGQKTGHLRQSVGLVSHAGRLNDEQFWIAHGRSNVSKTRREVGGRRSYVVCALKVADTYVGADRIKQ